jgi:curved DNA-binding protein CbpA
VPGSSHYQLLQVAPTASREELRQAFRQLSKRFHPDTTELPVAEAERAFQQLRQAYAVLSDPTARQRYDGELRHAAIVAAATNLPSTAATMATNPALRARPPGVRPDGVRRALSGGEWLALLLLGIALVFSLVLGVGMAWLRGAELIESPSWWPEAGLQPTMSMPMPMEPRGPDATEQTPPPGTNLPKPTYGSEASDAANPESIENQLATEQLASEQLASEQLSTEQLLSEQVSIEQVPSEQPRINIGATVDLAAKLNTKPNATLNANGNNQ